MLAVLEGVCTLIADQDTAIDLTGAEPYDWRAGTQYVYPADTLREAAIETGPSARRDFAVSLVFVAEAHEEAARERDAAVTEDLLTRQDAYLARIRANRSTTYWHHLAAEVSRPPATLTSRAIALRLSGYQIVGQE